jgi:hypothetical protein
MDQLLNQFSTMVQHGSIIIFMLNILLHICFAGGVARDVNRLTKLGVMPQLFPAWVWVLAVLIGSVFVAGIYWFMHHSTLVRRA